MGACFFGMFVALMFVALTAALGQAHDWPDRPQCFIRDICLYSIGRHAEWKVSKVIAPLPLSASNLRLVGFRRFCIARRFNRINNKTLCHE